jgi:nucleoside-diphosphate-sugar epimerase
MTGKLITIGASGYIGKHLYQRSKTDRMAYGTSSSGSDELIPLRLDASADFDYGLIQPLDVVFLTAAISAPDICAREYNHAWSVNVTGTSKFITEVIARGGRVVFFSSDTVYGERNELFDESAGSNPSGEYAVMKCEVEKRFLGDSHFKTIRLSYVFSREDKFTKYLSGCAERGEEADLFHPFYRAIVHRDDVVEGALALAARWHETPEQIINFGGSQVLSREEFAQCLREIKFHKLRFKVTEPDADFFKNRPRVIALESQIFARLLGRPPRSLCDAARMEFESSSNSEKVL